VPIVARARRVRTARTGQDEDRSGATSDGVWYSSGCNVTTATLTPIRQLYEARFPAEPRFVGPTRQVVADLARRAGMGDHAVGDLAVAVSEALTNGVLHAFPGTLPGSVAIRAESIDDTLTVTVTDDGVGMRPRLDSPGLGMGLSIMSRLCSGFDVGPGPDGVGTTVSMRFALR